MGNLLATPKKAFYNTKDLTFFGSFECNDLDNKKVGIKDASTSKPWFTSGLFHLPNKRAKEVAVALLAFGFFQLCSAFSQIWFIHLCKAHNRPYANMEAGN